VRTVDGTLLSSPLSAEEAAARISATEPAPFYRRRLPLLAMVGAAVAVTLALTAVVLTRSGPPTTMIEIDPRSGATIRSLHDGAFSEHLWGVLRVADGTLWQGTPSEIVRRDLSTGAIEATVRLPEPGLGPADVGAGGVFVAEPAPGSGTVIARYDQVSGKPRGRLSLQGRPADLRFGNGALWFLAKDGALTKIDPLAFKILATYDTQTVAPGVVVPIAGYVWICDCDVGKVIQFDPRSEQVVRTLELAQKGFLFGVDSVDGTTVWLLDPGASTLTPIDPVSGEAGRPIGVPAQITDATIAGGSIWVSSPGEIRRIDLSTSRTLPPIAVPGDVSAGSIAVDPSTGDVWVANCGCPRP
jgi:DNA-binding beta-propeller fold protein YncE